MGVVEFTLPDVGEGLTEAAIVAWLVSEGQTVDVDTPLVEIETAKANVELPSPFSGTIGTLHCSVGETYPVGTVLLTIHTTEDEVIDQSRPLLDEVEEPQLLVGYGAPASRKPPRSSAVRVSPPVRKMARELNIDLNEVRPTGKHGEITRQDLQNFGQQSEPSTKVALQGVRKHMARAMVRSATEAPQATMFSTIDATGILTLQSDVHRRSEFSDLRVTPFALIARCFVKALALSPLANASLDAASEELHMHEHVNLGIAVATPSGLIVPNIKSADLLDFPDFIRQLNAIISDARNGDLHPRQITGGTVTMTNIGALGIDNGVPLLNPGEAAIMAVGAITRRPWVVDADGVEAIHIRSVVQISLTIDHRILDGSEGARLLKDTADLISNPALALLH
jgi:2-oxoisovalerate dehydrogenase E2 component (dihydrolipoyl transacylase)